MIPENSPAIITKTLTISLISLSSATSAGFFIRTIEARQYLHGADHGEGASARMAHVWIIPHFRQVPMAVTIGGFMIFLTDTFSGR
jgi:hypothetical protein